MTIKPPDFVANLYRDLRDRRLLLPAAALLVALVAVPVLLTNSPPPPPPPPPPPTEATAASPAVMAEQEGIRNYRERLAALKEKNPFEQQFTSPEAGSTEITQVGAAPGGSSGGSSGGGDGGGSADSSIDTSAPAPSPAPTGSRGSTSPSEPANAKPKLVWWTWNVDLSFGRVGDVKERNGVKALEMLPSRKNPVVAFLGAGPYGKRATFLVSEEVTSNDGDGTCSPSKASCYFLKLRPGQERRLTIAPEDGPAVTYRLKLRKINAVRIKAPEE